MSLPPKKPLPAVPIAPKIPPPSPPPPDDDVDLSYDGYIPDEPEDAPDIAGTSPKLTETQRDRATERQSNRESIKANAPLNGRSVAPTLRNSVTPSLCKAVDEDFVSKIKTYQEAIAVSLPESSEDCSDKLFKFARGLLACEKYNRAKYTEEQAEKIFDLWFNQAKKNLDPTQSRDIYFCQFVKARSHAKYPLGEGPLKFAFIRAKKIRTPLCAERFEDKKLRWLIALCYVLQHDAGNEAFRLGCRAAGEILGVSHTLANDMLNALVIFEILKCVEVGRQGRDSRWHYLHPIERIED